MLERDRSCTYVAVAAQRDEDRLINLCSAALARHALREACYFDRYRANGLHGVALHFQQPMEDSPVFNEIAQAARAAAAPFEAHFMAVIDDIKSDLGAVFGGLDSITTYRDFSFDSAALLWQWNQAGLSHPAKRMAVATEVLVDYMYRTRSLLEGKSAAAYPKLFISFRSHFEGFAASLEKPGAADRAFEQRYGAARVLLERLVPAYEEYQQAPDVPWLRPWHALIDRYFERILAGVHERTLVTGMSAQLPGKGKNLLASDFHEKIVSSKEYTVHAMQEPLFQANRILLGLVYLTLFRLGLPLIERYFLCYCLSRYIEERHGVSAEQAFEKSVAQSARKRRWSWLTSRLQLSKAS